MKLELAQTATTDFPNAEAVVTHFSCGTDQAALRCTAQYLPLAFGLFESLLGARFPYRALQQVLYNFVI